MNLYTGVDLERIDFMKSFKNKRFNKEVLKRAQEKHLTHSITFGVMAVLEWVRKERLMFDLEHQLADITMQIP